ncbi:class I SAM-dependent methyltransferase [Ferruginibacter lapsinanis]|uniref:class I SAM-dependent methyltransferase n=1 Tax=Ferruginibacter lapsinanis TaxID=563172 RepID=UPI001E290A79|nr:class I SAM-dependent methyltransferase [Ferruginibacter lapsinanis]UEG50571.1 class I SAM-dependent methyltransferase [Ferruginibacter lapsinanis]
MAATKCIVCNQDASKVLENYKGYQEGEDFDIYYCSSCNTSFSSPHSVNDKIYDYIYSQSDVVPGYNRYALYAKEILNTKNALDYLANKEAMYFSIRETLAADKDKTKKILEVGSGLGYLTYAIKQQGYDITGLDISADAVKKATDRFGNHFICQDVYKYALDNAGKFDIVILTEVIEHLPEPNSFCDVLVSLLKPGGKLIITTPNKSATPPGEDYWDTESPPVHLTWFSEDSFRVIAAQRGLNFSFFDFTNFNKNHIDVTRFKYYKSFYKKGMRNRGHTLDKDGKVIAPLNLTVMSSAGRIKASVKKLAKLILEPLFILFLTDKKNPERNSILSVILQKPDIK